MSQIACLLVNAEADSERYGTHPLPGIPQEQQILEIPSPSGGTIYLRVVGIAGFAPDTVNGKPGTVVVKVPWN